MIDKVLILGIRRANQLIPDHEIRQMAGRCGRSYTESGEVTLIVPEKDQVSANEYMFGKSKPIVSTMSDLENLTFHCLPAIHRGEIFDESSFQRWFSRSLACLQGFSVVWDDLKRRLIELGCISMDDGKISLTGLGELSCRFYYPPSRLQLLADKMELVSVQGLIEDSTAISWMLSSQHITIGEANAIELADYRSECSSIGLFFNHGELLEGYSYKCILENRRLKWLKFLMKDISKDVDRLWAAVDGIVELKNLKFGKSLHIWKTCIERKLPYRFGKMALEFDGLANSLLMELESFGVTSRKELRIKKGIVESQGTDQLKNYLHSHATELQI